MRHGNWDFDMENFIYLGREYWESSMRVSGIRDMNIIGIDWRQSGLCAQRLVERQGIFRAVPMLAEGEYVHKRNGRPPEQFFCEKLKDSFLNIRMPSLAMPGKAEPGWNGGKGFLLLVSVPEARLERRQALGFAARLEQMAQLLLPGICQGEMSADAAGPGQVKVVLFPRIRVVWEHCRSLWPGSSGIGVVQVLEEETQFLLHPGQEVTVSFGDGLAVLEDGRSRQYYHKTVRYRENNYLYEPDRFLWQDASYASWYQAFGRICKKVFEAQSWEKECGRLAVTGSETCLPCAKKALADMDVASGSAGLARASEVPSYLLQWFCRLYGLAWDQEAFGAKPDWTGRDDESCGQSEKNIWDI